ncbi:MAG: hypothetical protein PHU04_01710 [Candidatus Peribacteraceae bacterium]|nr:hypothetical protein [Candidatus Peribacteraceae bacterium]
MEVPVPKDSDEPEIIRWYQHGVEYIEGALGISLSLIEKVRFKDLVRDSVDRNKQVVGHWMRVCLGHEAIEIFLHDYYGVPLPIEDEETDWVTDGYGREDYRQFWKKRQEESELP